MNANAPAIRATRDEQQPARRQEQPLARMTAWAHLPESERKRRAAEAAHAHDAETLADLTIAYMQTHGRCSTSTARSYAHAVRALTRAWATASVPVLRAPPTEAHAYVRQLEQRLIAGSARVHLAGCRALYRALRWSRATDAAPFADVRVTKRDARLPHQRRPAFPREHVQRLIDAAAPVDRVLVLLCAHAGLRVAEALALTWQHVDLAAGIIRVIAGKGGRDRDVEIPNDLARVLLDWSEERRPALADRVMPYASGTRARQRLDRLHDRAGIPRVPGRAWHSLRHTYGTAVYEASGDLSVAQDLLGHANASTTRGYVHRANRARLRATVAALPVYAVPLATTAVTTREHQLGAAAGTPAEGAAA